MEGSNPNLVLLVGTMFLSRQQRRQQAENFGLEVITWPLFKLSENALELGYFGSLRIEQFATYKGSPQKCTLAFYFPKMLMCYPLATSILLRSKELRVCSGGSLGRIHACRGLSLGFGDDRFALLRQWVRPCGIVPSPSRYFAFYGCRKWSRYF